METLMYKVGRVGTPLRTLLRDGLSDNIQNCLSTTKRELQNDIDYVESVRRVGFSMEELLMLPKKHSSKDSSPSLEEKAKKRKRTKVGDQRDHQPNHRGSGGKSGSKKRRIEDETKGQTTVHTDKRKPLE
jgi:hypothetical protein